MKRTSVINLFAGPGAGKSTTAADLFALMKKSGEDVELVTEYAKDLVWDGAPMGNQLHMLSEQDRRLNRLVGKVRWVVTDSPLLLGLAYIEPGSRYDTDIVKNTIRWAFRCYNNVNYLLQRPHGYDPTGRNQGTREEAEAIDMVVHEYLRDCRANYIKVQVGHDAAETIYANLKERGL